MDGSLKAWAATVLGGFVLGWGVRGLVTPFLPESVIGWIGLAVALVGFAFSLWLLADIRRWRA